MIELLRAKEFFISVELLVSRHEGTVVEPVLGFTKFFVEERKELTEPNALKDRDECVDDTELSLLRCVETFALLVDIRSLWSNAVSTRSIFTTLFMVGLLVWSPSQQLEIKSLIVFEDILVKSGR
ncbi:unnamed protein product [Pseudo-nitzschia multistriata]|uniref:Uncharacterized protein n=1 Tax=Pseudo-nitzschia multistriata TaxID=183589 RepID=A0A448ZNA0_9STRA|nr:unnamed protein product [Pseudo-nitzschia multistriata]